jgi:HTH-type transcriptional regulator, competence development regulator
MSTQLGKALKRLRLDHDHRLLDMAERLNVSVAFLSAIETGRKSPPDDFAPRVTRAYSLDTKASNHLALAADLTKRSFKVTPANAAAQETMALLARSINSLPFEKHQAIQAILKKGEVE